MVISISNVENLSGEKLSGEKLNIIKELIKISNYTIFKEDNFNISSLIIPFIYFSNYSAGDKSKGELKEIFTEERKLILKEILKKELEK